MKAYWDASALIAAVVEEEEHHSDAFEVFTEARNDCTSSHALAEVFATFTSGRLPIQMSPAAAAEFIESCFRARLTIIAPSDQVYRIAMKRCHAVGARGGAIYDMLHLETARDVGVRQIYTINVGHFRAFASGLEAAISLPTKGGANLS